MKQRFVTSSDAAVKQALRARLRAAKAKRADDIGQRLHRQKLIEATLDRKQSNLRLIQAQSDAIQRSVQNTKLFDKVRCR